jgi:hypothetical protein
MSAPPLFSKFTAYDHMSLPFLCLLKPKFCEAYKLDICRGVPEPDMQIIHELTSFNSVFDNV